MDTGERSPAGTRGGVRRRFVNGPRLLWRLPQNLKKSWHPQTLRNVEKVWKAEQKHEAERKKIEELQRELQEERAREEMQRYAEDMGTVR